MKMRYSGLVLVLLLAGCSASHTASPTSVLPGAPSLALQGVDPFNLSKNNVIHKYPLPNPNTGPFNMATDSDKNVWFTEQQQASPPRIGKITPDGVVTEYPIPSGQQGFDIAAGAGSTIWFTEERNGYIGKINTTTGHITEYTTASDFPLYIAKGPDGNMWFTEEPSGVGKITPTGTITEYFPPTNDSPQDIVAGPDGNLWFSEGTSPSTVAKITTSGTITQFPAPDYGRAIAAGPDGNLYATAEQGVMRITTAGVITEFTSSCIGLSPDIILGPDKQMWLSGCQGTFLQEFNPTTDTFSPTIAPDRTKSISGLTLGSAGSVWIAGNGGNDILVYADKFATIGIRLNGELSFTDPNYGFELGYAIGKTSTQTQTISLNMGGFVQFKNVDTEPHSAAFLGNATSNSAPWPGSFNGSTTQSPAGTAIGTTGWATGSLNPNKTSPIYETGLPGFYMIGCQYHYNTNEMRTVIVVH